MPGNMNNLMKQAQKMQRQMEENQKALDEKEYTAAAGGGAVEIKMTGKKEITKVTGYVRGGCTAIGMKKQFPTVVDQSAEEKEQIYISGGKLGMQLKLKPDDLCRAAGAVYGEITM